MGWIFKECLMIDTNVCGHIMGTSNSTYNSGIGLDWKWFVSSYWQVRMMSIVISSYKIKIELQKL